MRKMKSMHVKRAQIIRLLKDKKLLRQTGEFDHIQGDIVYQSSFFHNTMHHLFSF